MKGWSFDESLLPVVSNLLFGSVTPDSGDGGGGGAALGFLNTIFGGALKRISSLSSA